jgi:hypothetical protein
MARRCHSRQFRAIPQRNLRLRQATRENLTHLHAPLAWQQKIHGGFRPAGQAVRRLRDGDLRRSNGRVIQRRLRLILMQPSKVVGAQLVVRLSQPVLRPGAFFGRQPAVAEPEQSPNSPRY